MFVSQVHKSNIFIRFIFAKRLSETCTYAGCEAVLFHVSFRVKIGLARIVVKIELEKKIRFFINKFQCLNSPCISGQTKVE